MGKTKARGNGEGSIYQRKSDGRWISAMTLVSGKRVVFYGKTAAAVREKLNEARQKQREGRPAVATKQTLEAFLMDWLESAVKPSVRQRTFESYSEIVRLHIVPTLGRVQLGRLQPQDIQGLLGAKLRAGLSPRRVQYIAAVLRRALGQAERWDLIPRNVATLIDLPSVKSAPVNPFTPEEARAFISAIKDHRLEALYVLAIATGARQGELLGLQWPSVDLAAGQLHIHQTLHFEKGGRWRIEPTKTDRSTRTLELPTIAAVALEAHRLRQQVERRMAGEAWEDNGFVFASMSGRPLHGTSLTHDFQRLLRKAGLRHQRFHDLRHCAASLLLAQGAGLREIMEILGHSQIALTANLYTHLSASMKKEAASRMDRALMPLNL